MRPPSCITARSMGNKKIRKHRRNERHGSKEAIIAEGSRKKKEKKETIKKKQLKRKRKKKQTPERRHVSYEVVVGF